MLPIGQRLFIWDKTMKTLEQHNQEIQDSAWKPYPRPNGIECPLCKAELLDINSNVLLSYPGQKEVKCSKCVWTGTRLC